jgi:hypothetical protein
MEVRMGTLGQLYTRLILDTNRDDMAVGGELAQARIDAVADAVEQHADEQFWFNRSSATATTSAGDATLPLPAGIRIAGLIALAGEPLAKVPLERIEHRTETGRPARWAENEGTIQLWPIPDGAYALSIHGLASTAVPALESESNHWTSEAGRLILATAKKILYRGSLRDPEGYALARDEEEEALARLRRETRRRDRAGLAGDLPLRGGFDIVAG